MAGRGYLLIAVSILDLYSGVIEGFLVFLRAPGRLATGGRITAKRLRVHARERYRLLTDIIAQYPLNVVVIP